MNQTLKDDPDVKIPAAVKAAAARSEELYNTLRDQSEPSPNPSGDTPPEDPEKSKEATHVTLEGTLDENKIDPNTPGDPPQEASPEDTPPDAKASDEESWEHKYKSIHGRYVRSQEQNRQLADRIRAMEEVLASMQATATKEQGTQEKPAKTDTPELDPESLITDEERADYGEDFLAVVGKRARQEFAPVAKAYEAKIAKLEEELQGFRGHVQKSSQEKLLSRLDEKLPDWRNLNTNPEFLDWLGLPDPYSGAIRHDMLKAAYAQGDAHRVLAFFNGFLAEEAAVAPPAGEPDNTVTKVAKVPLEKLAAPGRAKTAAASPAPAEKPLITRAQIAAFYADVAAGKYRGRDNEKAQAEAQIFSAQQEGRIR